MRRWLRRRLRAWLVPELLADPDAAPLERGVSEIPYEYTGVEAQNLSPPRHLHAVPDDTE